jgi:predicted enzyme related to lactoylglutathione lyase
MAGRLVRFEFPARDTARAAGFYASLFGWAFQGQEEYRLAQAHGEPAAAISLSQPGDRGSIVYLDVDDVDEAIASVRELGGEAQAKELMPGIGWTARCRDTEGNEFRLFEADESVTPAM